MAAAKTYRAEAVVELSAPLWLGPEFLGLLKPASIGGVDVRVALPDFHDFETALHPRARRDWLAYFREVSPEEERDWPFGGVAKSDSEGGVLEFSAHRLLVMPREPISRARAKRFKAAVDDWVALLELWVEVIAREDLHRKQVWVESEGRSAVLWLDNDRRPEGEILRGEQKIKVHFGAIMNLSPRLWGRLLARTSAHRRPPEAHVFLRDARHALNLGHHRRSVLDSATATEVALAKLRDNELAGAAGGLGDYTRGSVQQIGGLSEFLRAMGRTLPKRIQQEVSEPRNKAIHAGHELDQETAMKALAKAEEVLELACPWGKLLE